MSGFELSGLIRFFLQVGLALSGASSLWGFIFSLKSRIKLVNLLMPIFLCGFLLFLFNWFLATSFFFPLKTFGHEGIVLKPLEDYIAGGLQFNFFFVFVFIVLTLFSAFLYFRRKNIFWKYATALFLIKFLLISFIVSTSVFTGKWDKVQAFFSLHSWHSILTLGTVLVIDFLYTQTLRHRDLTKILYPLFPVMSIAIWSGLGIDFLSVLLIFEETFKVNTQFIFNQTLIGIIIINGAFLSGRVNDRLIESVQKREKMLPKILNSLFNIFGSISIISWTSITFLDFFEFDASYFDFLFIYLLAIVFAFFLEYCIRRVHFKIHKHQFPE